MVVMQVGGQWRTDFIYIRFKTVTRIGSTLVYGFLLKHELCKQSHTLKIIQTGIDQIHQTDVMEALLHFSGQQTIAIQIGIIHRKTGTINGK